MRQHEEQPLYFSNTDLKNIVTPVKVDVLVDMLKSAGYPRQETEYLDNGFRYGFDIGYRGPVNRTSQSNNIPLRVGSKVQLWNKLIKEVELHRVAGPFESVPFENFIQSPIGLVPKGAPGSGKTHLIFHLSYDFDDEQDKSLNHYTPDEMCSVKYNDIDHAVKCYLDLKSKVGDDTKGTTVVVGGTSDVQSAFRLVPLKPGCWMWLIMKAQDPKTGQWKYFVDKCLPFGASISCAVFQRFSDALKFLIEIRAKAEKAVSNYLDDFLFIALTVMRCNYIISQFLMMCSEIGVPIADEKTKWAAELVVFLGLLLDGRFMLIRLPLEKKDRALKMLQNFIDRKKATVKELQQLCGFLNFLCRAIHPGRPFLCRMYSKYSKVFALPFNKKRADVRNVQDEAMIQKPSNKLKPHHHIRLDAEFKADCRVWLEFLNNDSELDNIVNRPMIDTLGWKVTNQDISFYSDASAATKLGYGCIFDTKWINGTWDEQFMIEQKPSIEYLKLFALTAGMFTWQHLLRDCRITIFCDNMGVVGMINKLSSSCKNCMVLIRLLTLNDLKWNCRINAKYVSTRDNFLADSLSRGQMSWFRKLGPLMDKEPHVIYPDLWPMSKLWIHSN